jgi:hypothetical protein
MRDINLGPGTRVTLHFAVQNGNIATAVREAPGWPVIVNLRADPYEKAPHESGLYLRWYADNIWLFVPVQNKLGGFLKTLPDYPFQQGSSLNASNINYNSLQAMEAMKQHRCHHPRSDPFDVLHGHVATFEGLLKTPEGLRWQQIRKGLLAEQQAVPGHEPLRFFGIDRDQIDLDDQSIASLVGPLNSRGKREHVAARRMHRSEKVHPR